MLIVPLCGVRTKCRGSGVGKTGSWPLGLCESRASWTLSVLYSFPALSIHAWGSFSLGQEGTMVILLEVPPLPPCLSFLPPAPITAPFSGGISPFKSGSGFFLRCILTFLCKEEADRDLRIISPPTCPSSLIRLGNLNSGGQQAAWRGWRVVVVAWNWRAVTNLFSLPPPPPKPQKPLEAQFKPALPRGCLGVWRWKVYVGPGQAADHILPQPHPPRATPLGSLIH